MQSLNEDDALLYLARLLRGSSRLGGDVPDTSQILNTVGSHQQVDHLARIVTQLERRLDLVERMLALQHEMLVKGSMAATSPVSPPHPHPQRHPHPHPHPHPHHPHPPARTSEAGHHRPTHEATVGSIADGHVEHVHSHHDDDHDDGDVRRVVVVSPSPAAHAMLMVNDKCRRGAMA